MYKNQLQELAQRSCFTLPSYTCIREGPDHAPRFKATVTFNGEVFESPGYHMTLRQAEHAAAKVALSTLSKRGPTQSLASRILDETGVCKNLLQETAQRAGVSLPVYTTIRSGPKHQPLFNCTVEVGGRIFFGEPAKTKKQAEKNAALSAWSALKQMNPVTFQGSLPFEPAEVKSVNVGTHLSRDERIAAHNASFHTSVTPCTRVRSVNARERHGHGRDGSVPAGQFYPPAPVPATGGNVGSYEPVYIINQQVMAAQGEAGYDAGQMYLQNQSLIRGPCWLASNEMLAQVPTGRMVYDPQASTGSYRGSSRGQAGRHQRRHSLSGMESPMLSHEALAVSRGSGGGNMLGRIVPHQQQIRGLPYQSLSDRFDLNRPSLLEELQLRDEDDEWCRKDGIPSVNHTQYLSARRRPWQSQSERFEFRSHLLPQVDEVQTKDEEEWLHVESLGDGSSSNSNLEKVDRVPGYREGWLRGETLMQSLQEQRNRGGYRQGWLQEEIWKHKTPEEERHGLRKGWEHAESSMHNLQEGGSLSQLSSYLQEGGSLSQHSNYQGIGRSLGDTRGKERGYGHRVSQVDGREDRSYKHGIYKDLHKDKSALFPTTGPVASPRSSTSSPLSSLWSKSTQWWGSHMPLSSSSAAAALANTLGLRPASSMAPAVRVRQMVPVCSAPPPRPANTSAPRCAPADPRCAPADPSPSIEDAEASVHQVFNSLRL